MKKEKVYYTWLLGECLHGCDPIETGEVYGTKKAALDAYSDWGPADDTSAVLVEVRIKPLSKLVFGGVKEVPLD